MQGASDPFIRFSYDGVSNRLSEQRPSGTTSYAYNAADELVQEGSTSYTYDQNGNQLSAGSRSFSYDLANRLTQTTQGNTTTTYLYDGLGKRLQASTGPQAQKTTNFLWDVSHPLPQLALERDGSQNPLRSYRYGVRRISQSAGSNTSYFLYDGLGSSVNLTSSSGATQWTWSYEPFGELRTEQKASGNQPDVLQRFTGEYLDPTGLYHLRARQYDPGSGRFLARDPVCPPQSKPSVSRYAYVDAKPTRLIDPSGLMSERPSSCGGLAPGSTLDGLSVGAASAVGNVLWWSRQSRRPRRRAAAVRVPAARAPCCSSAVRYGVPVIAAGSAVYEACTYRARGESRFSAAVHSAVVNGFAVVGAGVASGFCAPLGPTPLAVGCAGVLAPAGGVLGHKFGSAVWGLFS